jgi:hypothetical protein
MTFKYLVAISKIIQHLHHRDQTSSTVLEISVISFYSDKLERGGALMRKVINIRVYYNV